MGSYISLMMEIDDVLPSSDALLSPRSLLPDEDTDVAMTRR